LAEHEIKSRVVHHSATEEEKVQEQAIRPRSLDEFQGQSDIKENLKVFITAANERKEALDHVFLSGPPGLGKTTLAGILAQELGSEFRVTAAPALEKPKDLAGILTTMPERGIFFIDEIHRLKPAIEEMLYIAMEDFELDWVIGQGPSARTLRIPVPPFTLVGATTKPGRVTSPLFSRFGIHFRLNYYSQTELENVLKRTGVILGIPISAEALKTVAVCSRGTPRVANRLLRRLRDFMQMARKKEIDQETAEEGLRRLQVDELGLDSQDRAILRSIIQNFQGGPVGADTLAITVGEGSDSLEDFYEPYLIQKGFIQRTPRGRIATRNAYLHVGLQSLWNETTKEGEVDSQRNLF